jgi:signal transduction histidine kinase
MRTLLVLSTQPAFQAALHSALDPAAFQMIAKPGPPEAALLLNRGAIDAAILDADMPGPRALKTIEEVRTHAPGLPIVVFTAEKPCSWEEDAYLLGVAHVLGKPLRSRLFNSILRRLFPEPELPSRQSPPPPPSENAPQRSDECLRGIENLRRFASVLTHSLDAATMLKQFLLLLREIIAVNRAIVFLRRPASRPSDGALSTEDRWLRSACAIGIDPGMLQHFGLSLNSGIGAHLNRHGRVLRVSSPEVAASRDMSREFQLLGAQVAIPILDRESLVGIAVLDERLTGQPYGNDELSQIFHLLEEIGLAVRNAWAHQQLSTNHSMAGDILAQLGSAAIVFGANCGVLHMNHAARDIFLPGSSEQTPLEFNDLPQMLGSMVFSVLQTGEAVRPFTHAFSSRPDRAFRVRIVPFHAPGSETARAALVLIDDISEHERARKLETEASNLRLVKSMAEHLAHEIGNALVPISTHQQLLKDQINDPEFQESLGVALAAGVKRITRLASQMVFLAREWQGDFGDDVPIGELIVDAFHEAHAFHPGKKVAQLSFNKNAAPWKVRADSKALRHAFSEIILNALQANPENPIVSVNLEETKGDIPVLQVEVRDSGAGFSTETAQRAPEPFFSTRNVGLGIGLTVSRRIIESHQGRIEIAPSAEGQNGVVRVSLPIDGAA